jgi:hypothetical protein
MFQNGFFFLNYNLNKIMTIICKNWKCIGTSLSSINLKVLKIQLEVFSYTLKHYFAITNVHMCSQNVD